MRVEWRKLGLALAAPVLALVVAFLVTSIVLLLAGDPVVAVWTQLLTVPRPRLIVGIINGASVYYLSAIAVAIGFRMNLFNIGVDGQYRVAAFAAAVFAGQGWLPGPLNIFVSLLIAVVVGSVVGRHRRLAQGQPRRIRGDLDDHAQRHRHRVWCPSCCSRSPTRQPVAT